MPNALTDADRDAERLVSRLRFRHLRLLTELQRGGSLRAAAQTLNLTQPALSKALGEIERAFGIALFERNARGLIPTPAGLVATRGAELLLRQQAHLGVQATAGDARAVVVRVGAPPFVAQGYLPAVLARLARRDPPVRVQLLEERVPLLMQALADGVVDALITSTAAQLPQSGVAGLRYQKLFDAEFTVIAPPTHPLTRARHTDWQRLAQEPWIMPAPTSMVRRILDECFMRAGVAPPVPAVESTSPVTNVQLVAAGVGLSAAPAASVQQALRMGHVKVVRVLPAVPTGPVSLVVRDGPDLPQVAILREALGLA